MRPRLRYSPLLTVAEVAEYLRKHPKTVYRYIREHRLLAVHDPDPTRRGVLVRPSDLEAYTGRPLEVRR